MYYDYISEGYDELHRQEQENKIRLILENVDLHGKVLDVGCGTGLFLEKIQDICEAYGVDPSQGMLDKIRTKANVRKAPAEELPFPDNYFDLVVSITAVHNFDDIEKGLKEMRRVARSKVVFSILKKSSKLNSVLTNIDRLFDIDRVVKEDMDCIYFCTIKR